MNQNQEWENVMQKHAKSFYLASLFFPKKFLPKVKALYALCRFIDDSVDEASNVEEAKKNLEKITSDLRSPISQMPVNSLYKSNTLDTGYMEDLMEGAADDLQTVRIQNKEEFIQYCYKVAGTVGLAMFDLMDVQPTNARANAVDLGIAMQITNICRDIKEDLERDRIYIPQSLLEKYSITENQLKNGPLNEKQLSKLTIELLGWADLYYRSASLAYKNIPFRTRGAIIIAAKLYRGIGLKLKRQGANPMKGRVWLNPFEKTILVMIGLIQWTFSGLDGKPLEHNQNLHLGLEKWRSLRSFQF